MDSRKSWDIKDEQILDDLVSLMDLTSDETQSIVACQAEAAERGDAMVDAFYNRLLNQETTAE